VQRGVTSKGQGVLHAIVICTVDATATGRRATTANTASTTAATGSVPASAGRPNAAITPALIFLKGIVWEIVEGRIERRRGDGRADVFRLQRLT
jgi:hypothetical protein